MKRVPCLLLLFFVALASAQFLYRSNAKGFLVRAESGSYTQLPGPIYKIQVRSGKAPVYVQSTTQGLELYATSLALEAVPAKDGEQGLRTATATGKVRAIQKSDGGQSDITGSSAKYTSNGKQGTLTLAGPVRVTNTQGSRQTLSATGSQLTALLSNAKGGNPLRTATLTGGVTIKVRQGPATGAAGTDLLVSANSVRVDNTLKEPTITLTGGVKVKGRQGAGYIDATFGRAVIYLDKAGEVSRFEATSGGRE